MNYIIEGGWNFFDFELILLEFLGFKIFFSSGGLLGFYIIFLRIMEMV